jgi:hypothetical protein
VITTQFVPGEWKVTCSMCGKDLLASQAEKNWQGMYRCPQHNEPRQPQDFVRGSADVQTVPFAQPPNETFITAICTPQGMSSYPDYALPDCSIPELLPIF